MLLAILKNTQHYMYSIMSLEIKGPCCLQTMANINLDSSQKY